jgi:hypothetical protein
MSIDRAFTSIVCLAQSAASVDAGVAALVRHLARARELRECLREVDPAEDVASVRRQIEHLIHTEPPPSDLPAVYFGLFDTVDDDGTEMIGYYVAGAARYDVETSGVLGVSEDGPWWPERRYLNSSLLDAVKRAELIADEAGRDKARDILAYSGELGMAMLVSKFASEGLFGHARRIVGFDSGDVATLEA